MDARAVLLLVIKGLRAMHTYRLIKMPQARLDDATTEEDAMGHDGRAEDAAGEVDAIALDDGAGGDVAAEHFAGGGVLDVAELNAEADHDAEDEGHNEVLEEAEADHAAVGAVEEEEDKDVDESDGAAGDEGDVEEEVEGDGGADDFGNVGGDDGGFGEDVEDDVEPVGEVLATVLGEVEACDAAELDAEGLEEDSDQVGHEDDEEVFVLS